MRLLAVHPDLLGDGPDLGVILGWMVASGHAVQVLRAGEAEAGFSAHLDGIVAAFRPDVVLAYGATTAGLMALERARALEIGTVLMIWGLAPGSAFANADRVLVPSEWLRMQLRAAFGVVAEVLPAALPAMQAADAGARGFLGFVDPVAEQGASVFARVAATLAATRPDIPMLVLHGAGTTDAALAGLRGSLGEEAMAQVVMSPALADLDLFALVQVLLLPSVVADGCAGLASRAGWHGVPVVASDRGALPEMVGAGGVVLALPAVVLADARLVPGEAETAGWVAEIERLWDDAEAYAAAALAGSALTARHCPAVLRERYETFFSESYG